MQKQVVLSGTYVLEGVCLKCKPQVLHVDSSDEGIVNKCHTELFPGSHIHTVANKMTLPVAKAPSTTNNAQTHANAVDVDEGEKTK